MNKSIKNDFKDKKLRWDLLPLQEIEDIVKVYTAGAEKYGDNNWQGLENGYQRYKAALFRHLLAYEKGEINDQETHCQHLACVAWNAIAMLYLSKHQGDDHEWNNLHEDKTATLIDALDERIMQSVDNINKLLDELEYDRNTQQSNIQTKTQDN